jgi:hypothetical protein
MRKLILLLSIFVITEGSAGAENLRHSEFTLKGLFGRLYKAPNDSVRSAINDSLESQLSVILCNDSSFYYAFDSLPYLGKILSTDQKIRIYSWNYITDSGDYHFCCWLQLPGHDPIRLEQKRSTFLPDEDKTIDNGHWYGALYYYAQPFYWHNETLYILLGWSRYSSTTNFKVLEMLSLKDSALTLGLPVIFAGEKTKYRVILPYSSGYSLSLLYEEKQKMFLFNHLHAGSGKTEKIPDETFSGYQIAPKGLIYKEEATFNQHKSKQKHTKVELNLDNVK